MTKSAEPMRSVAVHAATGNFFDQTKSRGAGS